MAYRILFLLLFIGSSAVAQDKLLLTNGRIKKLKGKVVYYDYNDIFYQSDQARERMLADSAERAMKKRKLESTQAWREKQQAREEKTRLKKEKQLAKIATARSRFEERKPIMEKKLSPADFEIWKQNETDNIQAIEQKYELYWLLREENEEEKAERGKAVFKRRYTASRSRANVFAIIREDGSEEIVYNADTLGLLADGDFEVEYGVEDMRLYIKGRQDGRKHSFHDVYIGAGVGLISGLVFTYTLDMFYAPIAPAICVAVIAGLRRVRPNPKLGLTAAMLESDPYMDGYYRSAKGRKIFAFTVGAIGGLGVGMGTAIATSPLLQNR